MPLARYRPGEECLIKVTDLRLASTPTHILMSNDFGKDLIAISLREITLRERGGTEVFCGIICECSLY